MNRADAAPTLQVRKLGLREVEQFASRHIATNREKFRIWMRGSSDMKLRAKSLHCCFLQQGQDPAGLPGESPLPAS